MSRRHIVQTALISAAILVVVIVLDFAINGVLFPGAYTPIATIAIAGLVTPAAVAFLVRQNALVQRAKADIAVERAAAEAARDAAEAATLAKSQFLANMSHEIRTPLNGVLGMTQALEQRDLDADARAMVATIRESGASLMAILNDVLDLSKIEAGKMDIVPVDGQLMHTLNSIHKLFLPRADEKGLQLILEAAPGLPDRLCFDAVRVRQCVSNLVSNAVKFTRSGSVAVRASAAPAPGGAYYIEIVVSDTGVGMDEAAVAGLFQTFSQADASTTREFGGTGLGLVISRNLALKMGGDILARSQRGQGSTFTFTFTADPARTTRESDAQSPAAAPAAPGRLRGARVLLTDDNAINRQVARLFLQPHGVEITEAADGQEALARLGAQAFDLVLLDVHMPVMDGPETIRAIRSAGTSWSALPVIALTADAMSGDRERLIAMGMSGYVSKPIDRSELLAEIGRVLGLAAVPGQTQTAGSVSSASLDDVLFELDRIAGA